MAEQVYEQTRENYTDSLFDLIEFMGGDDHDKSDAVTSVDNSLPATSIKKKGNDFQ